MQFFGPGIYLFVRLFLRRTLVRHNNVQQVKPLSTGIVNKIKQIQKRN